ncbi:MAG: MarR family transcriptional regulator [Pseudonocardia sp.]|nr:MarR family transcriptional regulator [Pseudonocardia sp.]
MATEAREQDEVVESVLAAARVLVALSAQSVAESADTVTLPQLRVLVMLASQPSMNLNGVAGRLGVHPSNATRAVERLVAAGLLDRRDDPADRRNLLLELTPSGNSLVQDVMQRRRDTIADILEQMSPEERHQFSAGASAFAAVGGEFPSTAAWSLGWTTTP